MDRYTAPEYRSAAVITIDMQCDTLDGQPFEIAGTSAILPKMQAVLIAARSAGMPIVHIVRIYRRDGSNVDLCRRRSIEHGAALVLEDTEGCQIAPGLLPDETRLDAPHLLAGLVQTVGPGEAIIYKPRWGAFYQTPLSMHLRALGASTLIFMGCNFPNCPRTSIYEASERDYRIVAAADAISGLDERGVKELRGIGVRVITAEELIRNIERTGAHERV